MYLLLGMHLHDELRIYIYVCVDYIYICVDYIYIYVDYMYIYIYTFHDLFSIGLNHHYPLSLISIFRDCIYLWYRLVIFVGLLSLIIKPSYWTYKST
jgi:hypothetical protein